MSDIYYSPAPQNPPPGQVLRLRTITVRPKDVASPPPSQQLPEGNDPWGDISVPMSVPQATSTQPTATGANADPWGDIATSTAPATPPPQRQVGTGEAVTRGAIDAASFGLTPTLAGLNTAATAGKTPEEVNAIAPPGVPSEAPGLEMVGEGLARIFGNHPDPAARDAFERGRQVALDDQRLAQEQHPLAFLGGQFVGGMMTPGFGATMAGTLPARLAAGAVGGGIGGGLYGGGSAISEGAPPAEVASRGAMGAVEGAGMGAVFGGTFGPRTPRAPVTSGQRAASTAQSLGAPLPRGVTSDSPFVQATTAKLQSVPAGGEKIGQRVKATETAAGEHIGDIASTMTGGINDRAGADVVVRPGLQQAIDNNRAAIDAAYNNVRGRIDQNARFTMPRTDATLNRIMADRAAAGWINPAEGLEQFRNVAGGATFNGAHRARVDARNAGNGLVPHPGYNAADYNRLTRAMTADLRQMVQAATGRTGNSPAAIAARRNVNDVLNKLVNAKGEGAISTLLGAAKEKGGNVRLLAQLRGSMPQAEFEQIGGMLLGELGQRQATGEFSLAQFVTNWNKVSDRAKGILFDPAHLQHIEDIVGMGEHIKGALSETNTSKTSNALILYELAHALVEGAVGLHAGVVTPGQAVAGAAGVAAPMIFARWLASPAKAASMAAWARASSGYRQGPTPARRAIFNVATRNLANNLGIDPAKVIGQLRGTAFGEAESEEAAAGGNHANPRKASR